MSIKEIYAPGMEYRRDIGGNYLVLKGYADNYRIHMLEHNRIPGLLRVTLHEDDCRQDIHYEVGSLESLRHILDSQTLTGESVSRIIRDLFRTVRELSAYMLDKNDILLDPDYMYLDENQSLMLCYVPNNAVGIGISLSELLRSMLAAVDNNDHDSVVLTYSLYQESLRENYVIDDLMRIIRNAGRESETTKSEDVSYDKTIEQEVRTPLKVAEPEPETGGMLSRSRKKLASGWGSGMKLFRME